MRTGACARSQQRPCSDLFGHQVSAGVGAKRLKRADELVSMALALDPNSAQAHATKAYMLLDQMRLDEALAEDESSLALDPAYSDAYVNMGDVSRQLGRFEKA